jgi:hypothetical protein
MNLCKERGGTVLDRCELLVLERLVKATYRKGQPPATTIIANIPVKTLQDTLADGIGYSVRSLQRALTRLVGLRLVEVQQSRGRNRYVLHLEAMREWETTKAQRKEQREIRRQSNSERMRAFRQRMRAKRSVVVDQSAAESKPCDWHNDLVEYATVSCGPQRHQPQPEGDERQKAIRAELDALEDAWRKAPLHLRKEHREAFTEARRRASLTTA